MSVGFGNVIYHFLANQETPESTEIATTPTSTSTLSPVSIYFLEALPIIERHAETVEAVNKAIEAINSGAEKPALDDPSKTQMEAIETPRPSGVPVSLHQLTIDDIIKSLTTPLPTPKPVIPSDLQEVLISGVDTLESAINCVDSEILDWERLTPPSEAQHFHDLILSYFKTERAGWDKLHSYNSSVLSKGYGDEQELDKANMLSLEARVIWLEACLALDELDPTPKSK